MKSWFWFAKYYFDMVEETGECSIAYDAVLRLWRLPISYVEVVDAGGRKSASSFGFNPQPRFRDGAFRYRNRRLDVAACWEGGEVERNKYRYEDDLVSWELVQLRSRAEIRRVSESRAGIGYGEYVTIKVPPWKLGISKLYWGRYISPKSFLTWIVADGTHTIRYGVVNDQPSREVEIDNASVRVGQATLRFTGELRKIFEGDVFRDWLPGFVGWLGVLLKGRRPRLRQNKSVCSCEFQDGTGSSEQGIGVAETVWFEK